MSISVLLASTATITTRGKRSVEELSDEQKRELEEILDTMSDDIASQVNTCREMLERLKRTQRYLNEIKHLLTNGYIQR